MNILITGGAGFIGSNFLEYMVNKYPNNCFICLDALTYAGSLNNLKEVFNKSNFKFIKGNICDESLLDTVFKNYNINYVINFAAESHVDNSLNNPNLFIETNIKGTNYLLNKSRKYNIKRYHQVSTDEVYGSLPIDDKTLKFKEDSPLKPSNPYSVTKASADLLVLSYNCCFNLPVTISRCSNNYGPKQHLEKLIPKIINRAINNLPIPIYGSGENIRDWIYVIDHVKALDLIFMQGKSGNIYNIGGNCEKTNLEIVKKILELLKKENYLISFEKDRPGHDQRYSLDTTKIEKELNFTNQFNLDKGLKLTIDWYLKNKSH